MQVYWSDVDAKCCGQVIILSATIARRDGRVGVTDTMDRCDDHQWWIGVLASFSGAMGAMNSSHECGHACIPVGVC